MSSNDPTQPTPAPPASEPGDRGPSAARLEAISMMRFMPPGSADIGADVTREELREAELGSWSDPCGRTDDLRGLQAPSAPSAPTAPTSSPEDPRAMEDFDEVLPLEAQEPEDEDTVIELRFSGS